MVIEFQTAVEMGKILVDYYREDVAGNMIVVARYETSDALKMINELMARVQAEPHMIFDIQVRIVGANLTLSRN
jgi:hypothetical protein